MVSEYAALTPGRRATREVSTLTSHARLVHVLPGNAAPKSAGRYAAYNRRDCFRATARTKVNHFVRSLQTRAPAQFGILRLAQLPRRLSPAKCLIMRHTRSCRSPAHKQKIVGGLPPR